MYSIYSSLLVNSESWFGSNLRLGISAERYIIAALPVFAVADKGGCTS